MSIAGLWVGGIGGAWYDPSDLSTLFQDSAAATPVTSDSDPVGYIADKSGNGHHLTQGTADARPLYKTSGGLHWLDFDGTDDKLVGPAVSNYITASTYEWCVSYLADTIGTNVAGNVFQNEAVWGDDAGIVGLPLRSLSGGRSAVYNFDGTVDVALREIAVATPFVTSARHEGGAIYNLTTTAQGTQTAASGDTTSLTGLFQLGRQFNADTYCMDGRFYGGMWRKTVFTADERAAVRSYLAAKTGIAL